MHKEGRTPYVIRAYVLQLYVMHWTDILRHFTLIGLTLLDAPQTLALRLPMLQEPCLGVYTCQRDSLIADARTLRFAMVERLHGGRRNS